MTPARTLLALASLCLLGALPPPDGSAQGAPVADGAAVTSGAAGSDLALPDTALAELNAGRFWHAARLLRAAGYPTGDPAGALLLARAEAGWHNWSDVAELLAGATWLDAEGDGEGWWLLGRAHEARERWAPAAEAYRRYVSAAASAGREARVLARLARAAERTGDGAGALEALDAIPSQDEVVRSWAAVELARRASEAGDTALTVALGRRVLDARARSAFWRLVPEARVKARDPGGAEEAYRTAARTLRGAERTEALVEVGRLALERGDTALARGHLLDGIEEGRRASVARAAEGLLRIGGWDRAMTLRLAALLDGAGRGGPALRAYDRALALAGGEGSALPEGARLARARLLSTVPSRRAEALEEFRAIHASTADERIGARNLELWARMRRRQGRTGDVSTLRTWLLERYPGSPEAAEVVWARGWSAETRGDVTNALRHYASVARDAPDHNRAGQARMRTGQIRLAQGRLEAAAGVFEAYLRDFPEGRRWEEASYWAARSRLQLGDTAVAARLVERVRVEGPVSYYAVMGSDLLGLPYEVAVPEGSLPADVGWLTEGLRRIDRLEEAGLNEGADAEEARLTARARGSSPLTLRLAEGLIERGRTIAGINLGWALRRDGHPWDRRLLKVVYPFPHRELVAREAAEWGLDPIMLAALIRQESAFEADIVSHAGAIGLMQVMPTTGRGLARTHGPSPFDVASLTAPEVNLHLGAAFLTDMSRRYGELPLVLSAYNAGPSRANRWRRYPEAADPLRFTERIPFDETRGYVKNVRRNLGLYQALYGSD